MRGSLFFKNPLMYVTGGKLPEEQTKILIAAQKWQMRDIFGDMVRGLN